MADLRVLSLGWGVQSWTLAAMIALGEQPPIDFAVHADTTHEKSGTYEHAMEWAPWLYERGVKVVTVKSQDTRIFRDDWGKDGGVMIPAYSKLPDGSLGIIRRQCTDDWKIAPIRRAISGMLTARGLTKTPGVVELVQGISLDEWQRMKDSDVAYITNSYPLVDARLSRASCAGWLEAHSLPIPPKSSCTFCPFHSPTAWKQLKAEGGQDWRNAVAADDLLATITDRPAELYVHSSHKRLEEAVRIPEDDGNVQMTLDALCDGGYCGV